MDRRGDARISVRDALDKAIEHCQQEGDSKAVEKLWQHRAYLYASSLKGKDDLDKELSETEMKTFIASILKV